MIQNGFSFTVDTGSQAKMQQIMDQLGTLKDNPQLERSFRRAAGRVQAEGIHNWSSAGSQYGYTGPKKYKKGTVTFSDVWKTLNRQPSRKKNTLSIGVGYNKKSYHGIGKMAHIFDRGTNERYTKQGYYRGHIFRTTTPNNGPQPWTKAVNKEGPRQMTSEIIPALNRALTTIIVK